jgi:hypothetical protein
LTIYLLLKKNTFSIQRKKEKAHKITIIRSYFIGREILHHSGKKKSPAKGAKSCFGRNAQKLPYFEGKKKSEVAIF